MKKLQEIYKENAKHLSIEARDLKVIALDSAFEYGMAARVVSGGRLGFAYSTKPTTTEKELFSMADSAASHVSPDADLIFPAKAEDKKWRFDKGIFEKLASQQKIELCLKVETAAKAIDKRIKGVRKVSYDETVKEVQIKNSSGVDASFESGLCSLSVTVIAEDQGSSEWASDVDFALDPSVLDAAELGRRVAKRALACLGGRKIGSQKCACILERDVVGNILSILAPSFFADFVHKKKSIFADKIGQKVYSDIITIVNDVGMKGGLSSVPCDAEGGVAKRTVLVENGRLNAFLSDAYYANKMNILHTSSSVRPQVMQMPKIGVNNFYIEPGQKDLSGLKKEMGRGLFVTDVLGLHTANPITGDFSIGVSGFWIENGLEEHAVKGITIAGNMHKMFQNVQMVGSDLKFWHSTGAPSLLLKEVIVGGD